MLPEIIDLREKTDVEEASSICVDALRRGKLAVFPTETVYGLAALASNAEAVGRLITQKGRRPGQALTLAISSTNEMLEYVPDASSLARRFARLFWPGPLTLVLDASTSNDKLRSLPEDSLKAIVPSSTVGFRVPRDSFLLRVLSKLREPIVLTSANYAGKAPAASGFEVRKALGDLPDLIVDAGKSTLGAPSTVVLVKGNHWKILRQGSITETAISEASVKTIAFVCSGNTCRSPLAEVICKNELANQLNADPNELEARGYRVLSAGVAAQDSSPASPPALRIASELNLPSLANHRARTLDAKLAREADAIYVMSSSHLERVLDRFPNLQGRARLLCADGSDISDPFGATDEIYRACAEQIRRQIHLRLPEMLG